MAQESPASTRGKPCPDLPNPSAGRSSSSGIPASAIVNGYDTAQRTQEPDETKPGVEGVVPNFRANSAMFHRIARLPDVGLSRRRPAIALAEVYWTLWSMAELVTRWHLV
jgi:hypothetical protein